MTRGRPPIKTKDELLQRIDRHCELKGIDSGSVPKNSQLFEFYMQFPPENRPSIAGLARLFQVQNDTMNKWIHKYERMA